MITAEQFKNLDACKKPVNTLTRTDIITLAQNDLILVSELKVLHSDMTRDMVLFMLDMPGAQQPLVLDYVYGGRNYISDQDAIEDNIGLIKRALMFKVATANIANMIDNNKNILDMSVSSLADLLTKDAYFE